MRTVNLSKNLRVFRLAKHLTQEDMASLLNIERQSYCNYENGNREPSIRLLVQISELLGVGLDQLVLGDGHNRPYSEKTLILLDDFQALPDYIQNEFLEYLKYRAARERDA